MNTINVRVFPAADETGEPIEFSGINYISLVNEETYGIPALIAEERVKLEGLPVKILYVNPQNISAMEAERVE
jgi:hypothetical protein